MNTLECLCGRVFNSPSGRTNHQKTCPNYRALIAANFAASKEHNAKLKQSAPAATVVTVDLPDGGQCNVWVWGNGTAEASYRPDHLDVWGPPNLGVLVEQQS